MKWEGRKEGDEKERDDGKGKRKTTKEDRN